MNRGMYSKGCLVQAAVCTTGNYFPFCVYLDEIAGFDEGKMEAEWVHLESTQIRRNLLLRLYGCMLTQNVLLSTGSFLQGTW